MKKADIRVGFAYTDNRGAVRLVLDAGPQYVLYTGQAETDNLRYRLIAKKRGPHVVGDELNCSRASFANWAAREVPVLSEPQERGESDG